MIGSCLEDSRIARQLNGGRMGYKRKLGCQGKTGWASSNEMTRTWTLPGKKLKIDRQCIWMQDEPRTKNSVLVGSLA